MFTSENVYSFLGQGLFSKVRRWMDDLEAEKEVYELRIDKNHL